MVLSDGVTRFTLSPTPSATPSPAVTVKSVTPGGDVAEIGTLGTVTTTQISTTLDSRPPTGANHRDALLPSPGYVL